MRLVITLDPNSNVDAHVQIFEQLRHAIVLGIYRPGDKLPTNKEMCEGLQLSPRTVQRVYTELAREGLTTGEKAHGTTVLEPPRKAVLDVARQMLSPIIRDIRALNVTEKEAQELVVDCLRDWFVHRKGERRNGGGRAMPVEHERRSEDRRKAGDDSGPRRRVTDGT